MLIFIDDGSTNIKLAWTQDGKKKTLISANSFKPEWSLGLGDVLPANYDIDGEKYSFDPLSVDAVNTTESRYQYSDINVIAIHHALLQTGLKPQQIDVVVTLPLSEYLDSNNQPNKDNIKKKKSNVKRKVSVQNGNTFIINKVSVLPESIPAGFDILSELDEEDSLLIVDLGGTTLDVSHVRGKMNGIIKMWCDSRIGVSIITEGLKEQLSLNANTRVNSFQADHLIIHRNDEEYLRKRIPDINKLNSIINTLHEKEKILIKRVTSTLERFTGYTHVMCVGGGADIISTEVRNITNVPKDRFFKSDNPQFDLVLGMLAMKGNPNE
ncbi:plasmid segregation protein ParM (plasmid) [Arsenophonus nasoniae]|uniref:Plasmid segregation protein ParM n=1 Tax=Arsenophonus nasoniae TaxID=638 RepID=A0A4P7L178_9GAMM|nr:plasmid segregation protein ParM [Arsenophonus nasoniae]QBY46469.1 Plasmid segregation protein ParM [Arsenophonus nasoniae]WGM08615.1 plasmid segregation protein ParM [Arsenophonus nasoniae]WGM13336.1 plasmid segregation protein ParM [Arsenophonus nasoniae]WGM17993.1 plasmid segregation protein ParM [Arsenophonus nasoniae]